MTWTSRGPSATAELLVTLICPLAVNFLCVRQKLRKSVDIYVKGVSEDKVGFFFGGGGGAQCSYRLAYYLSSVPGRLTVLLTMRVSSAVMKKIVAWSLILRRFIITRYTLRRTSFFTIEAQKKIVKRKKNKSSEKDVTIADVMISQRLLSRYRNIK